MCVEAPSRRLRPSLPLWTRFALVLLELQRSSDACCCKRSSGRGRRGVSPVACDLSGRSAKWLWEHVPHGGDGSGEGVCPGSAAEVERAAAEVERAGRASRLHLQCALPPRLSWQGVVVALGHHIRLRRGSSFPRDWPGRQIKLRKGGSLPRSWPIHQIKLRGRRSFHCDWPSRHIGFRGRSGQPCTRLGHYVGFRLRRS